MPNVLILGDLHLERLETMFQTWKKWSFAPLYQAQAYAIKHKIPEIIQTGDVFDTPAPSQNTIAQLVEFIRKSPLIWHFPSGNHDISDSGKNSLILLRYLSRKHKLHNCKVYLKPTRTLVNKIPTIFLPWPHFKHKMLKQNKSLVVAHIERKGAHYDSGRKITENAFKLHNNFWVIGHLHEQQDIYIKGKLRGSFVGAVLQLRQGDSAKKYMLHLTTNKNLNCKIKKVRIKLPYTLKTIRVNSIDDSDWQKEFEQLKPNTFIRLQMHTDVVLPQKYLAHPSVLRTEVFGNPNIKETVSNISTKFDAYGFFNRMEILQTYLEKFGLKKQKIKLALKFAKRYEQKLK